MAIQSFVGRIQQRFSTLAVIEAVNPILLEGEVWIEKNASTPRSTGRRKVGDGVVTNDVITGTAFIDLPFEPSGGGGATNLSVTGITATAVVVASDTGTDATLPVATSTDAGIMSAAQATKLAGVATGATANAADSALRDRSTHIGTQAVGTITGLGSLATQSALGSITSSGAIGSTASLPIITTSAGALTTGLFGTTSGTFCQGDDARVVNSASIALAAGLAIALG